LGGQDRHAPRKRGIQYSAALVLHTAPHWRSGIPDRPVEPGDDRPLEPPVLSALPRQAEKIAAIAAARRSHEVIVAITLQSTVGGFSPEFMRKLTDLEQAMVAHGLEPSQFVISKDWATPATAPFIGPFFYDYTVFVGEENFTVTEPNDIRFLDYFYQRCIAQDEAAPEQQRRRPGLISRIFRWMERPI